jgi:hypothetical protein
MQLATSMPGGDKGHNRQTHEAVLKLIVEVNHLLKCITIRVASPLLG